MTLTEQRVAAKKFAKKWADKGDEKQDTRSFWEEFMEDVLGIEDARDIIKTEYPVDINGHQKYIDVFYQEQEILIEQKSFGKSLNKRYPQSGGDMLTPFEQGRRYAGYLPYGINARWVIVCNFQQFEIHDLKRPGEAPIIVDLSELDKQIGLFRFFVSDKNEDIIRETEISKDAGEVVGRLYDALKEKYVDPENEETQRHLNILVTRLVFCMYAEDAGLFGDEPNRFLDYIKNKDPETLGEALERLFRVLDMPESQRNQKSNISPVLRAFPYVNGGLFKEEDIEIPLFDEGLKKILVEDACAFNWADISPTIFGAVFESTLNPETRRSGGMHYTSIENIHKVIDPLFLDDLKRELREIQATANRAYYKKRLLDYQDKLAHIKILDPACGSGNFLTESYLCLRKLENIVFSELISKKQIEGQMAIAGIDGSVYQDIKVSISQFYGIEINDFAVTVAKTALWIAEAQMYEETRKIFFQIDQSLPDFFPLTTNATIVEGNALRMNWNDVIDNNELNYIMGNPPFVGYDWMIPSQKEDMQALFGKKTGRLDYVTAWYIKAADYIQNTKIECAFVSTNSIVQGVQLVDLWGKLIEQYSIEINFCHRTFVWDSEASDKASVHVIIIGFSIYDSQKKNKVIIDESQNIIHASNISPYLTDAPSVIIKTQPKVLSNVPQMILGNMAKDGGGLILSEEEFELFQKNEPTSLKFIKRFMMGKEFINNIPRYCLWLPDISPEVIKSSPLLLKRIRMVKEYRESSKAPSTRKLAETPTLFAQIAQPNSFYIAVPAVSSCRRRYIPIGYLPSDIIAGHKLFIIPNAEIYHFGVLTSNVHNAWMRLTAGRLKSDYSYNITTVYNTFPWPAINENNKTNITSSAQAILDARNKYPESSLATLYDETLMPIELRKAHQANDMAVMEAYGFYHIDEKGKKYWYTEEETVAALMKMYQNLTQPDFPKQTSSKKTPLIVKVRKKPQVK